MADFKIDGRFGRACDRARRPIRLIMRARSRRLPHAPFTTIPRPGIPASRAWRREQMEISNDIAGLPRDPHGPALAAALDALDLTDAQRIEAMTAYFRALAAAQDEADR